MLGHLGAILRPSWAILGPSWGRLGAILGVLGRLGTVLRPSWGHLGTVLGPSGDSKNEGVGILALWILTLVHLEAICGQLGQAKCHLGVILSVLGRLGAVLGPSWGPLGTVLGPSAGRLEAPKPIKKLWFS